MGRVYQWNTCIFILKMLIGIWQLNGKYAKIKLAEVGE